MRYWEKRVTGYAPGVIELDFDRELKEDEARRAFLSVFSDVRAKLTSFRSSVPLAFLENLAMFRLWEGRRYETIKFLGPLPTDRLLATVANLEELVGIENE